MINLNDTIVVGGGLAGLTAATRLAQAGRRPLLLERHTELGGRARTDDLDGWRFNQGAHALYRNGVGHAILRELGVEPDGEPAPLAGARLAIGDRTTPLPLGASSLIRTQALRGAGRAQFAKLIASVARLDPAAFADVTVDEWLASYRPDVRRLATAVVRLATYVADTDLLSADAAITQLAGADQGVLYLHEGWASLCRDLRERAEAGGATIHTGVSVDSIRPRDRGFTVTAGSASFEAATVVVAAGGPSFTARLLGIEPASFGPLGPPAEAAALDLALDAMPSRRFLLGLEEPTYFSVHSPPARMSPEGKVAAVAMRYLAGADAGSADHHRASLEHVVRLAGVGTAVRTRFLRRMTVMQAIPIASGGGLAGRPGVDVPGVADAFIAGDWVGGRGLLAEASIASGHEAARTVERVLDASPAATLG